MTTEHSAMPPDDLDPSAAADERGRARTPRELAAILNPGVCRPEASLPDQDSAGERLGITHAASGADAAAPDVDGDDDLEMRIAPGPLSTRARGRLGAAQLLLFRVGSEWFACDLATAEEAIELPDLHRLPEMPTGMLGVFELRGRMLPVYSPAQALGVALRSDSAAVLVVRADDRRIGLAVDDVEDVLTLDLRLLRDPPGDEGETVVLGVVRRGGDLVAVLDTDALVAACLTDRTPESV